MDFGPTEYEIYSCLALTYFKRSKCDFAIIEACMGGRFDCTNILEDVRACVITKLSYEHTSQLGTTLEEIAWHKSGIIKEGIPVVSYHQDSKAMSVIEKEARLKNSPLYITKRENIKIVDINKNGLIFDYEDYKSLFIRMPAVYQTENAQLALLVCRLLSERGVFICEKSIREGIADAYWQGRFEYLNKEPDFILDCCHNPDGAEAFVVSYKALYGNKKAIVMFGVMKDKDYASMLSSISEIAYVIILIQSDISRALSVDILNEVASNTCDFVTKSDTIENAVVKSLRMVEKNGVILCLGSHFHVDRVKKELLLQGYGGLL